MVSQAKRAVSPSRGTALTAAVFLAVVLLGMVSLLGGDWIYAGEESVEPVPDAGSEGEAEGEAVLEEEPLTLSEGKSMTEFCLHESRRAQRPGIAPGIPVQYIHIPKAGGTTLQENMIAWARLYGVKVMLHDGDHDGVWQCSDIKRGLLIGHRGFGFCQRMERNYGAKAFYIVALREPISRFRSLFDYIMSNNFWFFRDYHRRWEGRALSDLVVEYNTTLHMGLPAKHPKMWGPLRFWSLARQQSSFMCGWDCVSYENNFTTHQVAERAIAHLMRTDAVVIMEKLDDLIDQLRFHFTWVPPGVNHFPYENKHSGRHSTLTEQATAIVKEWSRIDIELYALAKERHAQLTEIARKCLNATSGLAAARKKNFTLG